MAFDVITPVKMGAAEVAISPLLTTLRTTPAASVDLVKTIDISNNGTGTAVVSLYLVASGGTAGSDNILIPSVSIPPKSIFQWSGIQVLDAGATVQANSTTANVCVHVSGGNAV